MFSKNLSFYLFIRILNSVLMLLFLLLYTWYTYDDCWLSRLKLHFSLRIQISKNIHVYDATPTCFCCIRRKCEVARIKLVKAPGRLCTTVYTNMKTSTCESHPIGWFSCLVVACIAVLCAFYFVLWFKIENR